MKEIKWKIGSMLLYTDKDEHESVLGIVVEDKNNDRFGIRWLDGYYSIELCSQEEQENGIKLINY